MRTLARYLFTVCAVVSLLLCLAVCTLWVRSYWVGDGCVWKPRAGDDRYYSTALAARPLAV